MPSTKYSIMNGDVEVSSKSSKPAAVKFADEQATENRGTTFTVVTGSGKQVHSAMRKPAGSHAAPWTRVDSSPKVEDLVIPRGYTTAYVRSRIPAAVARANDKSGWLVVTPEGNFEAADTKEAREVTNRLGKAASEARAKAREAEKARKAKEREAAKAAKEKESAESAA